MMSGKENRKENLNRDLADAAVAAIPRGLDLENGELGNSSVEHDVQRAAVAVDEQQDPVLELPVEVGEGLHGEYRHLVDL